ncbi:MAG: CaiB/BaiF CoA-transferase family protein [Burkholderiaceae bacterium]
MTDTNATLPLSGLRVVELHAIGPVPFAGQLLRRLGATIHRVSPPKDPGLGVGGKTEYDVLNAGKQVEMLDLKSADGMAALDKLLASADVMLEGFRPGVLERLGLAPKALLEKHPKLVVGRLSGWGLNGALADRAGHDINYLGLTGLLNAIGPAERPIPPLNVVADFGGGAMHLLVGVLSRLVQRSISGKGGTVETSILAGTVGLSPMFFGMLASGAWQIGREANLLDGAPPFYRVYKTKDDKFVSAGAIEAKFYLEMIKLTGTQGQIDPAKQMVRDTWAETAATFQKAFLTKTRDEWGALAQQSDCCVAPVLDFLEATRDPHNLANGLYKAEPFPQVDRVLEFDRDLR